MALFAIALAACGGGGGSAPGEEVPGASIESEGGEVVEQRAPAATDLDPGETNAPDGPARIRFQVLVKGEPVSAEVQLTGEDGEVRSGASGQFIEAMSGEHALQIRVTDGLVDHPVQRGQLTLLPGAEVTETMELAWAEVQLRVRINGRVVKNATVDIVRDGETVATIKSDADHVLISPGRYEAVVKARGAEMKVSDLQFPAESKRTIPVNVKM